MYDNQKTNSKQRGDKLPNYTMTELKEWFYLQPNQDTLYSNWVDSSYNKDARPSADRIDDYKPYSLDNIKLTTWRQNNNRGNSDRRDGTNNKMSKAVIQMSLDGEPINEFHSASEASRKTGITITGIHNCCNNKLESFSNFKWIYKG